MKRFLALCLLVFIGVSAWQIGSKLSADAIGMSVGVLFGVMAGIPTALLLLAGQRRRDAQSSHDDPATRYPHQPPVIVLPAPHYDNSYPRISDRGHPPALPDPRHRNNGSWSVADGVDYDLWDDGQSSSRADFPDGW